MPEARPERPSRGMIGVEVVGVGHAEAGAIIVVLREQAGEGRVVPIFIGETEGRAIDMRLRGERFPRPLTHDLLDAVLRERQLTVARIEIDDLKDGAFLGRLFLEDPDGRITRLDARPSDCIALAVGNGAPIFISEDVLAETGVAPESLGLQPVQ